MATEPKTLSKRISEVFRSPDVAEQEMLIQLARVAVLYEDLRLEFEGADAESLEELDDTSVETRRFYFVRRTLASLTEVEGAIQKLGSNSKFKELRQKKMSKEERKAWDSAAKFFSMHHSFLKGWRNDLGGHFLDEAAKYAVENIHPETAGCIEICTRGNGALVRMPFAYELVAVALTKGRGSKTEKDFIEEAFDFLKDAVGNAVSAMQIVVSIYLFDRFK